MRGAVLGHEFALPILEAQCYPFGFDLMLALELGSNGAADQNAYYLHIRRQMRHTFAHAFLPIALSSVYGSKGFSISDRSPVIWTRACALDKVIDAEGMGNVAVLGARCVTVPAHLAQRSRG